MIRLRKTKIILKSYFWVPLFIILCPTFPSIIGFGSQAVFVLTIIILLCLGYYGAFNWTISRSVIIYGCFFIGSACWDVFLELMRNKISPTDFLEIFRPVGFLMCFIFYRNSVLPVSMVETQTLKMIYWTFLLISIYCIIEFIFPDPIREVSYFLWKRRDVAILNNKAIGPFFQTYNAAYALLIPLFWSLIQVLKKPNYKNIIFFVLIFLTLLLTQSRSMYICATLGLCLSIVITTNLKSSKSIIKMIIIIGMIITIGISLFVIYQDDLRQILAYAFTGLESMLEGNSNSLNTRESQISWAIDNNHIALFGFGIGKSDILLESLYALYYYRYGVIGIISFILLSFYSGLVSWKVSKSTKGELKFFYEALSVFFIVNPIALSSSCHQDAPKTSLIFYGLMGMVFYRYQYLKYRSRSNYIASSRINKIYC